MQLYGVDFTSRPAKRKPITVAHGTLDTTGRLQLTAVEALTDFAAFAAFLQRPGPWLGAFDFPFGLPRELVETLGWPTAWPALIQHMANHSREALRETYRGFCDARPAGSKFAHRAADLLARSSSSMKWVNPPVAWMLLEGAPRLLAAGVHVPKLHLGDPTRVALEGYPALVARAVIGNASYKSDEVAKQTPARQAARAAIVAALLAGRHPLGIPLAPLSADLHDALIRDGSADQLDAVLCLVEAAWAWQRRESDYGLPAVVDPIEGWILTV